MSDRRQARARARARRSLGTPDPNATPRALLAGRLIEVWAEDGTEKPPHWSAFSRYTAARSWWLAQRGLTPAKGDGLLPGNPVPWSAYFLLDRQRRGEPLAFDPTERLAVIGARVENIPELQIEAEALARAAKANLLTPLASRRA